jgi:mRNA (guanine-N7-)-methyltransferase
VVEQAEFYETQQKTNNQIRNVSPIIFLRNFQNFIKAMLISEVTFKIPGLSVLDLCCGRGGDMVKWKKANVAHYVGLDFSDSSITEAQTRYLSLVLD